MMHRTLFTLAALLVSTYPVADAFALSGLPSTTSTAAATFTTALPAVTDNNEQKSRRREVFQWIRRVALFGAGASSLRPLDVLAAEDSSPQGKIVELTISNLEGNPDQSGVVKIQLEPSWAPRGVQRFEDLTASKFFDECRIFRVLPGFVSQFGIQGSPAVQATWRSKSLQDDPVKVSNKRGTVVFATGGPNTRTTQLFVNTADNAFLDKQGFSPIGSVIEGMEFVDKFYSGYGEGAPSGKGPNQGKIQMQGNSYLKESFPKLSYISSAKIVE